MRSHTLYSDRLIAQQMQKCGQYMVNISVYGEIFITKAEKLRYAPVRKVIKLSVILECKLSIIAVEGFY